MKHELRYYLATEHAIGAAVVNLAINGVIAWFAFGHLDVVPMWGQSSVTGDTIGTIFILTALTCFIATRIVRWHVRTGKAPAGEPEPGAFRLVRKLPEGLGLRSVALAGVVTVVVAPLAVLALWMSGREGMDLRSFLIFKSAFAAGLAACVQPIVALRALMEHERVVALLPAPGES
jgi:hypothetical protein